MKIYLRKEKKYIEVKENKSLRFLYNTIIGRFILKIIITKPISKLFGFLTNTKLSNLFINNFVNKNNINLEDYEKKQYKSFNDFFIRKIKQTKRKINKNKDIFISVADSKLKVYNITEDLIIKVKNTNYSIEELLKNKEEASKYRNGMCLIFRLCPDDYHHYIFPDKGKYTNSYHIEGKLHTVQEIAYTKYKVFTENDRVVNNLKTENFDDISYIEVGALNVGKIHNRNLNEFIKGEEKGYFSFGGSTIILLIKNNIIEIDKDILKNSNENIETQIFMGEQIGKRKK